MMLVRRKRRGVVDRPVDMTFGGQIENNRRSIPIEEPVHQIAIADIPPDEGVARVTCDGLEIDFISRISQRIEVDDAIPLTEKLFDEMRADEAAPAGH